MIPIRSLFTDPQGNEQWLVVFLPPFVKNFELEDAFHDTFEPLPSKTPKRNASKEFERELGGIRHEDLASIYKKIDKATKVEDLF